MLAEVIGYDNSVKNVCEVRSDAGGGISKTCAIVTVQHLNIHKGEKKRLFSFSGCPQL